MIIKFDGDIPHEADSSAVALALFCLACFFFSWLFSATIGWLSLLVSLFLFWPFGLPYFYFLNFSFGRFWLPYFCSSLIFGLYYIFRRANLQGRLKWMFFYNPTFVVHDGLFLNQRLFFFIQ